MTRDFLVKRGRNGTKKSVVVVSKAVAKKAVERNRIRRITKEALRELGYQDGLVIIVKNNIASLKMPEVKKKLENVLKNS